MILITGGLGFIGLNTAQALLDLGQSCVLTQHRVTREPDFIKAEIGKRVFIEQLDITDQAAFLELGKRYRVTGIIHLAAPPLLSANPFESMRAHMQGLENVLVAANTWQVPRVSLASSMGVYVGLQEAILKEDISLSMLGIYQIETFKKSAELIANFISRQAGFEAVSMRLSAIWGPLGRTASLFFATPGLIHAAVNGKQPESVVYARDSIDMCYVKDCGRAIALLQTTPGLNHRTYNVGGGRATSNEEVVVAIERAIPGARLPLTAGRNPQGASEDSYLDITRLTVDTGFTPGYNIERAVADYIAWLQAGNPR